MGSLMFPYTDFLKVIMGSFNFKAFYSNKTQIENQKLSGLCYH